MSIYLRDADFTLLNCDVLEGLATLEDESVHCVVTSPPYWGLRDYSTSGQLGLEPTPDAYITRMVEVFREVRRVLRRDGTLWLNIGDSYHHVSGGYNPTAPSNQPNHYDGDQRGNAGSRYEQRHERGLSGRQYPGALPGLKPKDLVGIPWRLAFALQEDDWYLRADIIWSKPNPMPESVTDRPTKAHEYVFLLTRSPRYFFDQEAVRESAEYGFSPTTRGRFAASVGGNHGSHTVERGDGTGGRNVRSVWEIATQPYPDAHFATYPEELVRRCILAGTSEHGCCPKCGAPWERETECPEPPRVDRSTAGRFTLGQEHRKVGGQYQKWLDANPPTTLGWRPGCTHQADPIPCTVLDPFLGSGTTAHVARKHGRRSIGIELNERYAELAARRMQQLSLFTERTR